MNNTKTAQRTARGAAALKTQTDLAPEGVAAIVDPTDASVLFTSPSDHGKPILRIADGPNVPLMNASTYSRSWTNSIVLISACGACSNEKYPSRSRSSRRIRYFAIGNRCSGGSGRTL